MTDNSRSRTNPRPERVVAFLLDVAETNTRLLIRSAGDHEIVNSISGRVPYSVRSTVGEALAAASLHVAELADVSGWDIGHRPSPTEENLRADSIRFLGRQLTKLAADASSRTIDFNEFEAIRVKLLDLGFALTQGDIIDVAIKTLPGK